MAEMKSITFCDTRGCCKTTGRIQYLTNEAMRFIIAMKWLVVGCDDAKGLLIGNREKITGTTCCVDIQHFYWRGFIVPGFCTRQLQYNGQVTYQNVIDPLGMFGKTHEILVEGEKIGRGLGEKRPRDSPASGGIEEAGPGSTEPKFIPMEDSEQTLVLPNNGQSVDKAWK